MDTINTKNDKEAQEVDNTRLAQQAEIDTSADTKRTQAWERLEKLISELQDFVQPKINVHKEIKVKVASIGSAFKRLKSLEQSRMHAHPAIVAPKVSSTPTRVLNSTEIINLIDSGADADVDSVAGDKRGLRKAKRQRSSPELGNKEANKRKKTLPTSPAKEVAQYKNMKATEWQDVISKKEKKKRRAKQQLKPPESNRPRIPMTRRNALIVRPKIKEKYGEILSRVKKDVPDHEVCATVDKIRRTNTGDLLIILTKENTDKGRSLQETLSKVLGDDANVISKGPQMEIEVRDLDDTTTKDDILAALLRVVGENSEITLDAVKSLRKAYGGTQTALVTLTVSTAEKILQKQNTIRIGWVNCRIRQVNRPIKCFKCWHYGHVAAKCKSNIDRSNLCIQCGEGGHKAATCKKDAICTLCTEQGNIKNCAHIAGSGRCPVLKIALQKMRKRQP